MAADSVWRGYQTQAKTVRPLTPAEANQTPRIAPAAMPLFGPRKTDRIVLRPMSPFQRIRTRRQACLALYFALCLARPWPALANEDDEAEIRRAIEAARRDLTSLSLPVATASIVPRHRDASEPPPQLGRPSIPERPRKTHGAPSKDWMKDLLMPEFPVHWDDQLEHYLEYYRNDPRGRTMVAAWFKNSGRYEQMITEKLRAAELPRDLLYVAMIESSFDPNARSPVGAVGLWQFVEVTGRQYDLTINRWADQRLSPEHATVAATKYFRWLHNKLGSWPLVLAAYNMGYGALGKAMRKYNTNNFWVLANLEAGLPYETVGYVAKATACAIVGKNPGAFGLTGLVKDGPTQSVLVEVPGGTSLGRLARAVGTSIDKLAELNPELQRQRLPPDVLQWDLHIPKGAAHVFERRWRAHQPARPPHREHRLRLGERLEDVAAAYDTTEPRLRALNGLQKDEDVERGHLLKVPDVEPIPLSQEGTIVVGVPRTNFKYPGRKRIFYRAIDGDTIDDIADALNLSPDEITRWNDLSNEAVLMEGMYVQLFVSQNTDLNHVVWLAEDQVEVVQVGTEAFFNSYEERQNRRRIRYRVRQGDTLESLSQRFGLSVGSIARINRFSRYENPAPNTEIILYVEN